MITIETRSFAIILVIFSLIRGESLLAAAAPDTPIPTIEVGAHLDRTTGLALDSIRNRLISASDDKTIRIWDLETNRLLRTLRVPSASRKEGEIYALAVEPKSNTAIVGGWTGFNFDGVGSIYVFDLDTGAMSRPLAGFNERILALAYSQDGTRLAVSLNNGQLYLFSVPDYRYIAHSELCQEIAHRIDFAPDGRLVTNCLDGLVRLYDSNLTLLVAKKPIEGGQLGGVHFSPDGKRIAVGYFDRSDVVVLNGETLKTRFAVDTSFASDKPLSQVAWSADGEHLYAANDYAIANRYQVTKWSNKGRGAPELLGASRYRIFRLVTLPGGGVAYTTLGHAVGIVDSPDHKEFFKSPPFVDHRHRQPYLRISESGDTVMFARDPDTGLYARFSLTERSLELASELYSSLSAPLVEHSDFPVTEWDNSEYPKCDGEPIKTYPYSRSHSMAISPKHDFFVIGVSGAIRRYNRCGELAWEVYGQSNPYALIVSGDGTVVVSAMEDGSLRWYRAKDGFEFMGLFPHGNIHDWVVWIPDGFFVSSPEGDQYIGWHLNNGQDQAPDFYTAFQFERLLYRPDLVEEYFWNRGEWATERTADLFTVADIRESAPPDIEISVIEIANLQSSTPTAKLRVSSSKRLLPIEEYTVFVNSIPVTPYYARLISDDEKNHFVREHKVPLLDKTSEIRVEAWTDRSIGVATTYVDEDRIDDGAHSTQGDLYVMAVGVNDLVNNSENSLQFAANDAEAIAEEFRQQTKGLFSNIHVRVVSDNSSSLPTRANIEKDLDFFQKSGADDTAILFLAAHGFSNAAGDYYFVPRDALARDLVPFLSSEKPEVFPDSLMKWDVFSKALRDASGRRLLIVDTCNARNIQGNFDLDSLAKHSAASSFALMAASKGNEPSQELKDLGHGLFTYGVLQALRGNSKDAIEDGFIDLSETYDHVYEYVLKNHNLKIGRQTPQLVAPDSLKGMLMSSFSLN